MSWMLGSAPRYRLYTNQLFTRTSDQEAHDTAERDTSTGKSVPKN